MEGERGICAVWGQGCDPAPPAHMSAYARDTSFTASGLSGFNMSVKMFLTIKVCTPSRSNGLLLDLETSKPILSHHSSALDNREQQRLCSTTCVFSQLLLLLHVCFSSSSLPRSLPLASLPLSLSARPSTSDCPRARLGSDQLFVDNGHWAWSRTMIWEEHGSQRTEELCDDAGERVTG